MARLLPPEELPFYVPGKVIAQSDGLGWQGVSLRSYAYKGQDVEVPAMRDFMLVSYRDGVTPMQRRFDGRWTRTTCEPGVVSLLTRSQKSHWHWTEDVRVTHIYLTEAFVSDIADEVSGRTVQHVSLADILRTDDPVMTAAVTALALEVNEGGVGGELYIESVARQLVIHLLRKYAAVRFGPDERSGELSAAQRRQMNEFIDANLHRHLTLKDIAAALNMSVGTFARHCRRTLGASPYAWVMQRRLERAQTLLSQTGKPAKEIASLCGFSDQAHLTRLFSREIGVTPSGYRRAVQGGPRGQQR